MKKKKSGKSKTFSNEDKEYLKKAIKCIFHPQWKELPVHESPIQNDEISLSA